jgi:hypothetical protein
MKQIIFTKLGYLSGRLASLRTIAAYRPLPVLLPMNLSLCILASN